ncbi:Trimethylamine:corrinoid methyltransferase [Desulfocicer vacuolatum DSM 3385]|uniref:Trimethylamine:corrinoid methyltransferase n=1 Tax=Desulfocicer vacuolatum DSM 3385 TaxID=1121400 RepID=A0A1W2DLP0_9BACT|nr:trimethylamine methyltransferase family protein [Desulfocicer vacuolatum]SMC97938.1 Trimethylamine:corrinoid methyltransferase [Desulfocicer vacuolatum DSM 3385]
MAAVTPSISLLTGDQIQEIHRQSLEILSRTGIRVDCPRALAFFNKASCRIANNNQVFIEESLVQWAFDAAPSSIAIHNRSGEIRFTLGGDSANSTRFGVGVTNLHYQDPLTDKTTPFSIKHMEKAVGLGHALEQFDVISTPGIAQDLDPKTADLFSSLTMLANTTKPLVLLISEMNCFEPALDMMETLHGNLAEKPFVIPYFNPITPLVLNEETAEKIIITAGRGLPFIYNNYGMSGATAPITPGGTLALLNAELLAGIVFAQLVKKGTPVIAGSLPAGFDMKNMMSVYTPHTMLINLACAEMMNHYQIPHSGTSGSGPGWGPDLIAGGAFWMNHLTSIMGKVGLAPFVGGNFDSMAFSPSAVVYANEVIRLSRIFNRGFSIDPETVKLDEINTMGSAGNYLAAPSTGKHFRNFRFESPVWPGYTLEQWQSNQCPEAGKLLREYTHHMIETLSPPHDRDALMDRGKQLIAAH